MILILIAVIVAGLIGWGAAAMIHQRGQAKAMQADLEAEQRREAELSRRTRALNTEINALDAEIARRKKHKKAGEPVRPLRLRRTLLQHERLRIGA